MSFREEFFSGAMLVSGSVGNRRDDSPIKKSPRFTLKTPNKQVLDGRLVEQPISQCKAGWWFQTFFYFHLYLGKILILTNIFQMG